MDAEEKALLKQVLAKVESLEKELQKTKEEMKSSSPKRPDRPRTVEDFGPLPKDKLARALVIKAREKIINKGNRPENQPKFRAAMKDLKENFSFAEIAKFAIEKRLIKEGKESATSKGEDDEPTKVILD